MGNRSLTVAACAAAVLAAALAPGGCGYVGEPLAPALNIASPIADLRAVEYGSRVLVDFTIPPLTTEGIVLNDPGTVDLRAGVGPAPFNQDRWAESARKVAATAAGAGPVHATFPAAEWAGKQVVVGVRLINRKGRASSWSNLVSLRVFPPLAVPGQIAVSSAPQGARLVWKSPAPAFRVYRRGPEDREPLLVGSPNSAEFIDSTARFGTAYQYLVQAVQEHAESEISQPVSITPKDEFPPAIPTGLNAAAGVNSVELVWEPNTDADLKGYRVYRATSAGRFERIAEFVDTPAYSDRQVEAGARYRYAIAAIDHAGNESKMTAAVEIAAP